MSVVAVRCVRCGGTELRNHSVVGSTGDRHQGGEMSVSLAAENETEKRSSGPVAIEGEVITMGWVSVARKDVGRRESGERRTM
jgi:hypothetical protein